MKSIQKNQYFIPKDIWDIITSYLGDTYWYHRKRLSELSFAIDLIHSDYAWNLGSYYRWKAWRDKRQNSWYLDAPLQKPTLPKRFREWRINPYIESVQNYILLKAHLTESVYTLHETSRNVVFGFGYSE